jgi:hypothetical protein
MKRRSFFHLLWGAPAVMVLRQGPTTETKPESCDESGPLHECVEPARVALSGLYEMDG